MKTKQGSINSKINWVKNHKGCPSTAQSSIMHCIQMLADFEAVSIEMDNFDTEVIVAGEQDFYTFMTCLYRDMYENPKKYDIPTKDYDTYMTGINIDEMLMSEDLIASEKFCAKENRLRQKFQKAIEFYSDFFYELGINGEICKNNYSLIVPKESPSKVIKKIDTPALRKDNTSRINTLNQLGIILNEDTDSYIVSSKFYPKMFLGLRILCAAPNNKYRYFNYLRLSYKGYCKPELDITDVIKTLDKEHADIVNLFVTTLDSKGAKLDLPPLKGITSSNKWKVAYKLKSKRVFEFYAGPAFFLFRLFFYYSDDLKELIKQLEIDDPTLFKWFSDQIDQKLCKKVCPNNKIVMIGNQEMRICGTTISLWINNLDSASIGKSIALMKRIYEM